MGNKTEITHRRWWLWLPLLTLAGSLVLFGNNSPSMHGVVISQPTLAVASVVNRIDPLDGGAPPESSAAKADVLLSLISRETLISRTRSPSADALPRNLFSAHNWNPPPPHPLPVTAPVPVPPPLPYSFLGKKLEGDLWEIYLNRGEQTLIVRQGQVLDGIYRVDKIEPPTLALTYLPLDQVQILPIGDKW